MTVGYFDEISKRRVREHCTENGISSTFFCPAVTKKLRHVAGEKSLVNPYQKPQRLITRLFELFLNVDDWNWISSLAHVFEHKFYIYTFLVIYC